MYAPFALLIILSLGLFLRLYNLSSHNLWFDEALCALQVSNPADIWRGTAMGSLPFYINISLY